MKVYEIISLNEALDLRPMTTLGPDGKPAGYEVFDTKTKKVIQQFTGPDAAGKAEEFRDKGNASSGDKKPKDRPKDKPSERIKKSGPTVRQKAEQLAANRIKVFQGIPLVSSFPNTFIMITVCIEYINEMAAINALWDAGEYNQYGDKAVAYAQADRSDAAHLCVTRLMSNMAALLLLAKNVANVTKAIRYMAAAIPGPGWVATTAMTLIEVGIFWWLNQESVQRYIAYTMLKWAWPASEVLGSIGEFSTTEMAKGAIDKLADAAKDPGQFSDRRSQGPSGQAPTPAVPGSPPAQRPAPSQPLSGADWKLD